MTDRIDPDSLPAHAIEAAAEALAADANGESPDDFIAEANHAVAAFLNADGWTVRREWRLCRKYRDGEWGDEPLVTGIPDYWVESRTVLTGPATKEKP